VATLDFSQEFATALRFVWFSLFMDIHFSLQHVHLP